MKNPLDLLKIFALVIIVLAVSLGLLNKTENFSITEGKWEWLNHKIFSSGSQEIDYLIVGSSRTWTGLKPKTIQEVLGKGENVVNFSRNWYGRGVDYILLRETIKRHKVKNIILEFDWLESEEVHPYFDSLADVNIVANEISYRLGRCQIADLLLFSSCPKDSLNILLNWVGKKSIGNLLGHLPPYKNSHECRSKDCIAYQESSGFYLLDDQVIQDSSFYNEFKDKVYSGGMPSHRNLTRSVRGAEYVHQIFELAKKNNIGLWHVYAPKFGVLPPPIGVLEFYNKRGQIIFVNLKELYKIDYWRDRAHLYREGTDFYSRQVAAWIVNVEQKMGRRKP